MVYRSNLRCPDLEPAFQHTFCEPYGGTEHNVMHDKDFEPSCGYMSHDEAAILYHIAKAVGGNWLEIGTHTGWSAAHVALAINGIVWGIDPQFGDKAFLQRTEENLRAASVAKRIVLWAGLSMEFFKECNQKFSGVVIDGNHDSPHPCDDARRALAHLTDCAAVVFHDCIGYPVFDGVEFLISEGFKFRVYNTPQRLAVCWRGDIEMPAHVFDPSVDWEGLRKEMPFDWRQES